MLSYDEWQAVRTSLVVGVRAVVVALPIAFALAWLLTQGRFRGRALLDTLVHAPLVLPPVVVGYALLLLFGIQGVFGRWLEAAFGVRLVFTSAGASLAAGVMALPMMVRAIRLSLEAVDRRLEDAASTLGASKAWTFATVTLPLALPGIIAGMVLCFAKALGEFGATITFVSNIPGETQTLSAAIYTYTNIPGGDAAAGRLVIVAIVIALAALVVSEWFARRAGMRYRGD